MTEIFRILVEEKLNYRVDVRDSDLVSDFAQEHPSSDVCDAGACGLQEQSNDTCCDATSGG